jgi:hypothetical protein
MCGIPRGYKLVNLNFVSGSKCSARLVFFVEKNGPVASVWKKMWNSSTQLMTQCILIIQSNENPH